MGTLLKNEDLTTEKIKQNAYILLHPFQLPGALSNPNRRHLLPGGTSKFQIFFLGTKHKVIVEEQLKRYFQTDIKLLTTQCIILEVESLGGALVGATGIVKKFAVHKCGHEGKPVSAAECIKSMTKDSRYIVATQDRTLQQSLRKVPGRCLLYLHRAAPVLEAPSAASKKWVHKKAKNILPEELNERIAHMKKEQGLAVSKNIDDTKQRKRKGPKNPNPLSCKKSKKPKNQTHQDIGVAHTSKTPLKPKRKRIKIPSHIKEALKSNTNQA